MSGELIVKNQKGARSLLAFFVTAAAALALMLPLARSLLGSGRGGLMTQIGIAILVPVLVVLMQPQVEKLFSGGRGTAETLTWRIADGTLTLGETAIPLNTIKMVYCWQKQAVWTVNIETTGKNQLLRSVDEEESVQRLYELVDALGYRAQWKEV